MKKIAIASLFLFSSALLFAYDNGSTTNNASEKRSEMISTNIHFVKASIDKKIRHAQAKIEKYRATLNMCQNDAEVQILLKKIDKIERQIKNLTEVLMGVETATGRLSA